MPYCNRTTGCPWPRQSNNRSNTAIITMTGSIATARGPTWAGPMRGQLTIAESPALKAVNNTVRHWLRADSRQQLNYTPGDLGNSRRTDPADSGSTTGNIPAPTANLDSDATKMHDTPSRESITILCARPATAGAQIMRTPDRRQRQQPSPGRKTNHESNNRLGPEPGSATLNNCACLASQAHSTRGLSGQVTGPGPHPSRSYDVGPPTIPCTPEWSHGNIRRALRTWTQHRVHWSGHAATLAGLSRHGRLAVYAGWSHGNIAGLPDTTHCRW